MGILDRLSPSAQFIEVIEWLDNTGDTMMYRFPVHDQEIKNGAQLIVRESQAAVFVHEGQIADAAVVDSITRSNRGRPIPEYVPRRSDPWRESFDST